MNFCLDVLKSMSQFRLVKAYLVRLAKEEVGETERR